MTSSLPIGLIASIISLAALTITENARAADFVYDRGRVNGHAGFLSAWRVNGKLDRPVILVKGYDTVNDDHPFEDLDDYSRFVSESLVDKGYDIIIFDYVDGEADLKENADNLAEFIRYLDSVITANGVTDRNDDGHPDYELSIIGGSMGGIVARTMFVQENEAMGVNIFVTLDSPHHGVQLSPFLTWATDLLDSVAGHQLLYGDDAFDAHFGWLQSVESTPAFKADIIDPIHTAAIALSNGESSWHLDSVDLSFHTKFHHVSSYVESEGIKSDYVPYHSAVNTDNTKVAVIEDGWNYRDLKYVDTHTSYFDRKIANPRDAHGGPDYAIQQAIDFVVDHSGRPEGNDSRWLAPIMQLLLDR